MLTRQAPTPEELEEIHRRIRSSDFKNLSNSDQYENYVFAASSAAQAGQTDEECLDLFVKILDGYLSQSSFNFSGTIHCVMRPSTWYGSTSNDDSSTIFGIIVEFNGGRVYSAMSGLNMN